MAAGINGSTIVLSVRTGTGPDVYTTVGGQRGLKTTRERTFIDTSAKDDGDGTGTGGRRKTRLTVEGVVVAGDTARAALITAYESTDGAIRVRRVAVGSETKNQLIGVITKLEEDFPDDDATTYSIEIEGNGAWTVIS
jgi:TP901-1 family phage major tail protein